MLCTICISAVENQQIPIFDKKVFEKVRSIHEFWDMMKGLLTIVNFELLKLIADISGSKVAYDILKEDFLQKFNPSAIEDMRPYWELEPCLDFPMLVLKVQVSTEKVQVSTEKKVTLKFIKSVTEMISKQHKVNEYALHFFKAERDPVVLCYYILRSVHLYLATHYFKTKSPTI